MEKKDTAILGYTGFVGSNLALQIKDFDGYNSKNLADIKGKHYKNIYYACVPGVKYLANKDPLNDLENILDILKVLIHINCDNFFLVSSQDCNSTLDSDENYYCEPPSEYGKNRLFFEEFIKRIFKNVYILRIGCLFGKNLRKNIIFDLISNNPYLETLKNDSTMQLYCLDDLKTDFELMVEKGWHKINRFGKPIKISEIISVYNSTSNKKCTKTLNPTNDGYKNKAIYTDTKYELIKLQEFFYENRVE